MQDHWEDRLHAAGKHDAAVEALEKFRRSRKGRNAQEDLYDRLVNLGCTDEEADEVVNLERESAE